MAIADSIPEHRRDPVGVCTEWMPLPDEEGEADAHRDAPPQFEPRFPPGRRRFLRADDIRDGSPVFPGEPA